jgi:genome maintenance exonuclease 1
MLSFYLITIKLFSSMHWNKKFNYPNSNRVIVDGSRYYNINDTKLPSVTEILKATESEEKKSSLLKWRQRVGNEEADRIMKTSSSRGTKMHKHIEEYLIGQSNIDLSSETNDAQLMSNKIINEGLCNLDELWGAEATLSFPGLYAGTADACGLYNGKESILDFKQSNKPKKREWIEDYFLQIAAYGLAHNKVYSTNVSQGVILVCTPPPMCLFQEFIISEDDFEKYQNQFLNRVDSYKSLTNP